MTNDPLSFLDTPPAEKTEPVKETPVVAEPAAKVEAPVVVEQKTEPVKVETVAQPKGDGHSIPLPKYLETFNEARDLRKRNAELEEAARTKAEQPDPLLDPEGYKAAQDKVLDDRLWDVRVQTSEIAARRFYGEEVVKAAFEALQAQSDPLLGMRIRRSADPWEEIVKWHKKEQLLASVGDDEAAYKARIIAEFQASQPPAGDLTAPATITPAKPVIPAASLSKAPAGPKASDVPIGPGQAFDTVFAR